MFEVLSLHPSLYYIFYGFLGLLLGSFATAMIYRIPRGESWIVARSKRAATRSKCPQCDHVLKALDLIPVFSWLFMRGRCRYCQVEIPRRYILIELGSSFLAIMIYVYFGFGLQSMFALIALPFVLTQGILFFQNTLISKQLCAIISVIIIMYVCYILYDITP